MKLCPTEEALKHLLHGRVGHDEYQLTPIVGHERTPDANSEPMSIEPLQSRSRGCCTPLMMSTDPSSCSRAARMSASSVRASAIGECVEI